MTKDPAAPRSTWLRRTLTLLGYLWLSGGTAATACVLLVGLGAQTRPTDGWAPTAELWWAALVAAAAVWQVFVLTVSLPLLALGRLLGAGDDLRLRMLALETRQAARGRTGPRPFRTSAETQPAFDAVHSHDTDDGYGT